MRDRSAYIQCFACEDGIKEWAHKKVYIEEMSLNLAFHLDCWSKAGEGDERSFETKKEWNEFAGKQYEISGRYLLTKSDGMWYYLKN